VTTALTAAELVVLQAAAAGETIRQTADRLHVSAETVKAHRKHIFWKLGAHTIGHAIATAYERGILGDRGEAASPSQKRLFFFRCDRIDNLAGRPFNTTKKASLARVAAEFGRPIESTNDLTSDEISWILDLLRDELGELEAQQLQEA
jgi:DNA-binding CsgD family transcriptional regulator